jgi:hypothetical protein
MKSRLTRIGSLLTLVLKKQATNKYLEARLSACMECLGKVVQDGVEILKSHCLKLISYTSHARKLMFQNFCDFWFSGRCLCCRASWCRWL